MDETNLGIIIGIYALVLWLLLFFVWRRGYQEWRANRALRTSDLDARIVDKREPPGFPSVDGDTPASERLVVFDVAGQQREFKVEQVVYDELTIGQEGTLHLMGEDFASFEPKTAGEQADDVYRRMMKG